MTEISLNAAKRGPGKASAARREGNIPAVVYGRTRSAEALAVPAKEFFQVLGQGINSLIQLTIEDGSESDTVMIKDIQRDPVRGDIIHVDFHAIALDELLTARVYLALSGEETVSAAGGILQHQMREIEVECLPAAVPAQIEADISSLRIGENITAGDLSLPPGVTLITGPDEVVASVVAPRITAEDEAADAEEAAEDDAEGAPADEAEEPPR